MIKALIHVVRIAPRQLIKTSLAKQLCGSAEVYLMKLEKLDEAVYFSNSLNHWPQRQYAKKASLKTPREQSVIVTLQLPATGSCVDDVTIGQHFEIIGSSDGTKIVLYVI